MRVLGGLKVGLSIGALALFFLNASPAQAQKDELEEEEQTVAISSTAAPAEVEESARESAPSEGRFLSLGTDRPGNGNAATAVPHLALQLETSISYLRDWRSGIRSNQVSFPTMLRFGLFDWTELRVGSAILGLDAAAGAEVVSPTDTSVGLKIRLLENDGALPALLAMADVFLPTGQNAFTGARVVPDARLALAWALPAGLSLLLNLGVDVPEDSAGAYSRFIHVANLGYTLPLWEERMSLFVESYGRTSFESGRASIQQIDMGLAMMVSRRVQLDFFTQHGLNSDAARLQLALGFSTRF